MEQLSTLLEEKKCHDICHDFHVLTSCHEEQRIDINDYRYLVEQLSKWRVFYPKAQIKNTVLKIVGLRCKELNLCVREFRVHTLQQP